MSCREDFINAMSNLDERKVADYAVLLRAEGCSQQELVDMLLVGMHLIGLRYESGEYFIADLIMSGILFRSILGLERVSDEISILVKDPALPRPDVLIGTVEGDIHDIGKDIFSSMLLASGLSVIDLGVDVKPEAFVDALWHYQAPVVVMEGTMAFAASAMRRTIEAFVSAGLRDQVHILLGGNGVNQEAAHQIGADAFSSDFISGVALCKRWSGHSEM